MTRTTTFENAVNWLKPGLILCNNIVEVDFSVYDNLRGGFEDEDGNPIEIYQWFLTSFSKEDVEWMEKSFSGGFVFSFSEKLDVYVMGVTHFGTPWCGVDVIVKNDDLPDSYL